MKKYFSVCIYLLLGTTVIAQTKLQVINDSIRVNNSEFIIRNNSRNVQGYLYNNGNGLTQFQTIPTTAVSDYQVSFTKTQLDNAIANKTLIAGLKYRVSGVCTTLYGGTDIIVSAVSNNRLATFSSGEFYTPNYAVYAGYDTDSNYASGDTITWGGYLWVNTNGNTGAGTDAYSLSSSEWQKIPYDTIRYIRSWDDIGYVYHKDFIFYRRDNLNNEVSCDSSILASQSNDPLFTSSPIKAFKWGSAKVYNNTIRESYAELINIDSASRVNGNTITSKTYFGKNKLVNCFLVGNIFEQGAMIESNTFKNADVSFNEFNGGSMKGNTVAGIYEFDSIQGAAIFYNHIENGSLDSNKILVNEGDVAWIKSNNGYGDIKHCFITKGRISNNFLSNGSIVFDTLSGNSEIAYNFVSGTIAGATVEACNIGSDVSITYNNVVLNSKILRSVYSVTNSSLKSYILEPIEAIDNRSYIGSGSLNLTLQGFAANRKLASDSAGNATWSSTILGGNMPFDSIEYKTTSADGGSGADHIFKVGNNGAVEAMRIKNNGNVGIGANGAVKLNVVRTTEQMRIGFDASNYLNFTVGTSANTIINTVGTATGLILNGPTVVIKQGASNRMVFNDSGAVTGTVQITEGSGTTSNGIGVNLGSGTYSAASGLQHNVALLPTINQSAQASYTSFVISPNISSSGTGLKNLLDVGKSTTALPATHSSLLRIESTGKIIINATNTATGSTGAKTIHKASGSINFAAAASTLVVTNSMVTAASMILLTIEANDATAKSAYISAKSAGSFTIKLNAAATAETKVNFLVFN
ncbi:MAG: hypothetical protein V4717_21175 [Bacteroidota bacterium]